MAVRPGHQVAPTWLSDQVSSWPIPIDQGITGAVEILHVLSDTQPIGTQGPVWLVSGRNV